MSKRPTPTHNSLKLIKRGVHWLRSQGLSIKNNPSLVEVAKIVCRQSGKDPGQVELDAAKSRLHRAWKAIRTAPKGVTT